jgi:FtsP/CotA-like multicopper oxidase with cupredoxin domain
MGRGQVSLNGRQFELMDVAQDEIVRLDTTEVWEFRNDNAMMAHPMHIHNVQFRVIDRTRNNRHRSIHATMQDGFTDEGLKDVVTVMPGERVRVLLHFSRYTGIYLYHCHILEHEDLGMMRNYLIEA